MSSGSSEPHRGRVYDDDLKWRMVYQREMLGLTYEVIATNLNVDPSTVWSAVKRFNEEGDVAAKKNKGNPKLTDTEQFAIFECVLNNPGIYLREIQQHLESVTEQGQ